MDGGCPIKRGFFTLRGCGEMPANTCQSCFRNVCAQHITATAAGNQCVECAAKTSKQTDAAQPEDSWYNRNTAYSYRDRYYTSTGYYPYYGTYYTDQDYRSFDSQNQSPQDVDEGHDGLVNS